MMVDRTLATGPLPRTEAADRRPDDPPAASVWQREMEKVQTRMWFKELTWQEEQAPAAEQARDGRSLLSTQSRAAPQLPGRDARSAGHHMPLKMSGYASRSFALPGPQVHQAIELRRGDNAPPSESPRLTGESLPVAVIARTEVAPSLQQDGRAPVGRHTSGAVNIAQSALQLEPSLPADQAKPAAASTASEPKQATSQVLRSCAAAPAAPAATPGAQAMSGQAHARVTSLPAALLRPTDTEAVDAEPRPPGKAPEAATSRLSAGAAIHPQQALRLHAEWHDDEIHLWVGKDGRVNLSHTQLRRWVGDALAPAQLRLAALVCNGIPIAIDGKPVSRGPPGPARTTVDGRSAPAGEHLRQARGASRWPT